MKLSFIGVAIIAMCLFAACGRNASEQNKSSETVSDITLSNSKQEEQKPVASGLLDSTVAMDENAPLSKEYQTNTDDTTITTSEPDADIPLQSGSPAHTDWDKKIIKTAKISLEVKDFKAFNGNIHSRIKSFGAYTAGEQQNQSDTRIENNLTIKVPVDQFDNLVNSIGGDGIIMLSKEVSSEDVSSELVDTKARIEAKKQLRDKYEELLKGAKTMKDILQVQSEINDIQEELEAAAGRVNYLSHSAAYSTITISYFQYLNGNSKDREQPSFFTNIKDAFATGGSIILNVLLFFISIWPLLLAGCALYVYLKKGKVRKSAV